MQAQELDDIMDDMYTRESHAPRPDYGLVKCANPHCDHGGRVRILGEFCRDCRVQQAATARRIREARAS